MLGVSLEELDPFRQRQALISGSRRKWLSARAVGSTAQLQRERHQLCDALRVASPNVGSIDVDLHTVAVRTLEVQ
jgi:hypothetical protein